MKKLFYAALCLLICLPASAQVQLSTKKYVISDFCEKTLNVILTGDDISDAVLRSEMPAIWTISAFEFCDASDFEKRKKSPEYYFLAITESGFNGKNSPGIKSLSIYKGCQDAKEGFEGMYKVVNVPYCPATDADGGQTAYIGPLMNILQKEVLAMMDRTVNLTSGVTVRTSNSISRVKKKITIDLNYIQQELTPSEIARYNNSGITVNPLNDSSDKFSFRDSRSLIGYAVSPSCPVKGSVCYTMLIDASTWELCYFRKNRLKEGTRGGFTAKELNRFSKILSK